MNKTVCVLLVLLFPVIILSQEPKKEEPKKSIAAVDTTIPVQSKYSDNFKLVNFSFNKKNDLGGRGEVLEVEFIIENLTDNPQDFYIFVVATYEKTERTRSSLERPVPEKERIRTFTPFPDDVKNFEYPDRDLKGNMRKDENGHDKVRLIKFPKDPKLGINPLTKELYHLKDRLIVRTQHLSRYRVNYAYFNESVVLIFDSEGKPIFRQAYSLDGYRRKGIRAVWK